ncbi:MAG: ATP-binding protein [Epsilonproteobacteria bacterium]|nr:ATP-binding protein [Campylobacterota bacterium]
MKLKKLPLGIQVFEQIIEHDYVYVDKTEYVYAMISSGSCYFLSRPRRFGKSLTLSTLDAIFSGRKELFKNLWIDKSDWGWKKYPVLRLDMSSVSCQNVQAFRQSLGVCLDLLARRHNIVIDQSWHAGDKLKAIVEQCARKGPVVVLIDEYDAPLLQHLHNIEDAECIRTELRCLYAPLKDLQKYLRFVFLTGVSRFSKTSIFSGLNNLTDLSMHGTYAALCGYTQAEIEHYFADHLDLVAQRLRLHKSVLIDQVRSWYNGYRFSACSEISLYNPISVLSLLDRKEFKNFWMETGSPSFLIKLFVQGQLAPKDIDNSWVSESTLSSFELSNINLQTVMVQAGYLTIKDYVFKNNRSRYLLGYPNHEVKQSFIECIIQNLLKTEPTLVESYAEALRDALCQSRLEKFIDLFKELMTQIPYDLYASTEKHYQTIFYVTCLVAGFEPIAEDHTARGRIDVTFEHEHVIYIIELKIGCSADNALAQIHEKRYYEKFLNKGKRIVLLGISFDVQAKTIGEWKQENL